MPPTLLPAALAFLENESRVAPDFSAVLVLAPHHQAGQAFRQALVAAMPGRHLRPPRIATLMDLAAEAGQDGEAEPDSVRLPLLRDFLEKTGQVPREALWEAAGELLALLDELDARGPEDPDWARLARGPNPFLDREAGIAREVWRALARGGRPSATALAGRRLRARADQARGPLYLLGPVARNGQEQAFLAAWSRRAPVVPLPVPPDHPDRLTLFQSVWETDTPPLAERARAFAADHPASPLIPAVRLLAAPGLEAAARAAEAVLLDWLAGGHRQIVLIALDRLMARRLRALLERRGILLQDETGWAFSTASASHAVECLLRLVTGNAGYRDLLDFLKSPFVLADDPAGRDLAAHQLDETFRRHGAPDGLAGHQALARREGLAAASSVLGRLEPVLAGFGRNRRSLQEWTRQLLEALDRLAIHPALAADPVGRQLLELLARLAAESTSHRARYTLADWRRWLFLHLEETTFLDSTVSSPLRLTHLGAAHTRDLEGAILLGAGTPHLPQPAKAGLFNDAARIQLGLPGIREREAETRAALMDVLARSPRTALVWQAEDQGEPVPLSPWLAHLDIFHRAAWGQPWLETAPVPPPPAQAIGDPSAASPPLAAAAPGRLSVSAWQSLVACPYQYHARHLLGLNERDEVQEEMEKADYGSLVHAVLARFHAEHPQLAHSTAEALLEDMLLLSRQTFAEAEAGSYLALAWRLRWERQLPAYLAWALEREGRGYHFQAAEQRLERDIAWGEGAATLLHGRVDRLDTKDSQIAVLDYKTQSRDSLRRKLDPAAEDVQLTAYAWLAQATETGFVTVDTEKVEVLARKGDLAEDAAREAERLARAMADLAAGAPLPASGAPGTCAWCEMRGLCRREHQA